MVNFDDFIDDLVPDDELIDNPEKDLETPDVDLEEEVIPPTPEGQDNDNTDYTPFYNQLKELGVLNLPEDYTFENTETGLNKAFSDSKNTLKEEVKKEIWSSLPEDFKPLLEYALNGGKNLESYIQAYSPVDYDKLDMTNVDIQKAVIRQYWKETSNHNDAKIDKMLSRLEDLGDLEDEAIDALSELKGLKEERKKNLLLEAKQQEEQRAKQIQEETTLLTKKIDEASNIDAQRKARVKAFLFSPISMDDKVTTQFDNALDQVLTNPDHLIQLADLLADYHPTTGLNLSRIEKQIKSQTNNSIKSLVNSIPTKTPQGSSRRVLEDNFNWEDFNHGYAN